MRNKKLTARLGFAMTVALIASMATGCAIAVHDGGPDKVLVCHKGKKTLSISSSALQAHLGHGDYRGACH